MRGLLRGLLKRKLLPDWLRYPRTVWAFGIVLAFIAGYLMGMYEEPDSPTDDIVADVREDPMQYHNVVAGDDYGFHRRKKQCLNG